MTSPAPSITRLPFLLLAALILLALASVASAESYFAPDLEAKKDDWPEMAAGGKLHEIYGRLSLVSKTRLMFKGLTLHVEPADDFPLPNFRDDHFHAMVRGRMTLDGKRPVFRIISFEYTSTEAQEFRKMRAEIDRTDPDEWYKLADWAATRARFYEDEELAGVALSARREGLYVERSKLPVGDLTSMRKLATRAKNELGLPRDAQQFLHDAYLGYWSRSRNADVTDDVLFRFRQEMPGAATPLTPPQPELAEAYFESPIDVYTEANDDRRTTLHRLLYVAMAREMFEREIDGETYSNGNVLATRIDKEFPELTELGQEWRAGWLDKRLETGLALDDQARASLEADLTKYGRGAEAKQLRKEWLADRVLTLRRKGPDGMIRAADLARRLDEGTELEVELLKMVWKQNPQLREVTRRLEDRGYRLRDGKWVLAGVAERAQESEVDEAVREGRIIPGMTSEQVRQAQGRPTSVSRIATADGVGLLWSYGKPGESRVVVVMKRAPAGDDATVLSVSTIDR